MIITIFDTSVCSENLGDYIIMDSVRKNISNVFPDHMVLNTATHEKISASSYRLIRNSNYSFVGGTNLLSSNMNFYNQWKINLFDTFYIKNAILLGVGWWQYQNKPNFYTRQLLKLVLHDDIIHSVRDSYTELMLRSMGINNVINTSCSTMWDLNEQFCSEIPTKKAENVVATLTDYNQDYEKDSLFLNLLEKNYKVVYIWPQGIGDVAYINSLNVSKKIVVLSPNLESFNSLLNSSESIDYVGTRLHAGIRAMQFKRRSIIIGIDNRAIEKSKDFNLKICLRNELNDLNKLINSDFLSKINLPLKNIETWKNQFK